MSGTEIAEGFKLHRVLFHVQSAWLGSSLRDEQLYQANG